MVAEPAFDPGLAATWIARGRSPHHAAMIAGAWRDFPDLPATAPLVDRQARNRARVHAMRPVHDAISAETERDRQHRNFTFIAARVARGTDDPRDEAILLGRDAHGLSWDHAVQFASGLHAARAGWERRLPSGATGPAYDLGFRLGGGDPDDLFDAARRALTADRPRLPQSFEVVGRPLPSGWPLPSDAPRPCRWGRRLLILGQVEAMDAATQSMLDAAPGSREAVIIVAGATNGFHLIGAPGQFAARDIAPEEQLRFLLAAHEIEDILVAAQGGDLTFVDRHAAALPLCRSMERTRNTPLQQRAHLKIWLARGLGADDLIAAGHIRWSKLAQGLSGRLGEFTARYTGPAIPRGHRICIEREGGEPAIGFATAAGEILAWETVISNRAHLRAAMTSMLRQFAAATLIIGAAARAA